MSDDAVVRHQTEMHPGGYTAEELEAMIASFIEMQDKVDETNTLVVFMVDDVYGSPVLTPAHPEGDPDSRHGGRFEKYDQAIAILENGGIKVQLPPALWAFLTAVTVALITGVVTLIVAFSG